MSIPESKNRWMFIVLFSTALRLCLAPFTGHPYDLNIWMETGQYVAGGMSPYEPEIHLGYPPLWGFWCGLSYLLSNSIWPGNKFVYILAIKIPIVAADLAIAWMLVALTRSSSREGSLFSESHFFRDPSSGRSLAALFLLNPYVLVVGVIWGMMDNIAALLVVLVAIALVQGKDLEAGAALGLAIALKLYPVIFLFAAFPYLARRPRREARALRFLIGLGLAGFALVLAPFLVFNWDIGGFLSVLADQTSRKPGGISPIGISGLLYDFGIHSIGGFNLQSMSELVGLRLIWIPAVCLSMIFIAEARLRSSLEDVIRAFAFVYMIWIVTTSWVSEQNVETLLILLLFQGAASVFGRAQRWSYGLGSAIVLGFVIFHVPATSFPYPVYAIEPGSLSRLGTCVLPWIAMAFTLYIGVEAVRTGFKIKSNRRTTEPDRKTVARIYCWDLPQFSQKACSSGFSVPQNLHLHGGAAASGRLGFPLPLLNPHADNRMPSPTNAYGRYSTAG